MTVLPTSAQRVDHDATKTAPPQGDSPGLQSAPEITLAELVEDLAIAVVRHYSMNNYHTNLQ
jgi:hypothetical protein